MRVSLCASCCWCKKSILYCFGLSAINLWTFFEPWTELLLRPKWFLFLLCHCSLRITKLHGKRSASCVVDEKPLIRTWFSWKQFGRSRYTTKNPLIDDASFRNSHWGKLVLRNIMNMLDTKRRLLPVVVGRFPSYLSTFLFVCSFTRLIKLLLLFSRI